MKSEKVNVQDGNNVKTRTYAVTHQGHKWPKRIILSSVVCKHTCSFWAKAVGLVSARSGSRYCRGSSQSDSLSNRGMARTGAGASMAPWPEDYNGTRRRAGGGQGSAGQSKQCVF